MQEQGWTKDRANRHAREPALVIARQNPPGGVSLEEAVAAGKWILSGHLPEWPPVAARGRLGYARIAADVPSPPSI
jgi:hypothetical protein